MTLHMCVLQAELEDLCFAVLQPEAYAKLRAEVDRMWCLPSLPLPTPPSVLPTAAPRSSPAAAEPSNSRCSSSSTTSAAMGSVHSQQEPSKVAAAAPCAATSAAEPSSSAPSDVALQIQRTEGNKGHRAAHSRTAHARSSGEASMSGRTEEGSRLHLSPEQKQVRTLLSLLGRGRALCAVQAPFNGAPPHTDLAGRIAGCRPTALVPSRLFDAL